MKPIRKQIRKLEKANKEYNEKPLSALDVAKFIVVFIIMAFIATALFSCSTKKKTSAESNYISLFKNYEASPNLNWQVLQPMATTWGGVMFTVDHPKYYPTDSLVIHVKKSQITWLNDSTAVIHKRK